MHKLELKIPPPLVTAVAGALMWLLAWMFPALALAIPLQQPLALLLLGLGLVLPLVCVWLFIQAKTTIDPTRRGRSALLVVSVFNRISRNPMYLGMLLVLLGWALWLSSLLALLTAPLFVLYMNRFQIEPEERFLTERFAEQYLAYKASVRRWI